MGRKRKLVEQGSEDTVNEAGTSSPMKKGRTEKDDEVEKKPKPQAKRKNTRSKTWNKVQEESVAEENVQDTGEEVKKRKTPSKRLKARGRPKTTKEDPAAAIKIVKTEDDKDEVNITPSDKTESEKGLADKSKEIKDEVDAGHSVGVNDAVTTDFDSSKKYVGAHVSISGGLFNAVKDAVEIGAKSFAMFLRSQRQWNSKPLDDAAAEKFREYCKTHDFSPQVILPHGIYLMNCGSPDDEVLEKSRNVLVDELQRCEKLGLLLYNFHPGSTCGKITVPESVQRIADSINMAHAKTKYVITVLENMSCQGHTIGGKFEELRDIISLVKDKSRVGVCLDTCHAFAAGFNVAEEDGYQKMMKDFEEIVGLKYLKAVHLNDSKGALGCHLDRHENIGKGKIGKAGFRYLMNDARFNGIPLILETPFANDDTYTKEIKLLYSMMK